MKRCAGCGESKPFAEFHQRGKPRRGPRPQCKACTRTTRRAYYERTAEKARADASAAYRAQSHDPAYRARNAAKASAYREAHPERAREAVRRWNREHPDACRAASQVKKARKRAVYDEHVHPLVVLELHDGACGICEGDVDPFDFHVDHVVPLARGGRHNYANTQPAHPVCNMRKKARLPEEFGG